MSVVNVSSPRRIEVIGSALRAAALGPFFPDWEFSTLMGISRDEMRAVASRWPYNRNEPSTDDAAISAIVNLCGYPHGRENEFVQWGFTLTELVVILDEIDRPPPR
jgi:hypothetical protein